jgi:murein DD-endopeptidase MepM/ murein hydrolase activator NlpD
MPHRSACSRKTRQATAAQRKFVDQFFPKPLRRDTIHLNDAFMQKVTTEIMTQTPSLADKGQSPGTNYLQINRDLRKANDAFLVQLAQKSQPAFLWREPFLPMVNTAIKASFASVRSYVYEGKPVDEQNHLGLDMASVRADPVPASNDGVVAFAGYLGIYGNCIVIDQRLRCADPLRPSVNHRCEGRPADQAWWHDRTQRRHRTRGRRP